MLTAPINKILPYSVVDGPGNRVAIFVQKCNIHCAYCHNPETQNLCSGCGACVEGCPAGALKMEQGRVVWDEKLCCGCDRCIKVCPNHASPKVTPMTAQQVFAKVCESIPFIRGITVSGGECGLYPEFLMELFRLAHTKGLSCLMDSNGTIDLSRYPELMEICDGVMLDVKSWKEETFRQLTGAGNEVVKKNLKYLADSEKLTEVRIVCLPGMVDAEDCILGISRTLSGEQIRRLPLKLIRFRHFGVKGALENHPSPDLAYMQGLEALARAQGFEKILIL